MLFGYFIGGDQLFPKHQTSSSYFSKFVPFRIRMLKDNHYSIHSRKKHTDFNMIDEDKFKHNGSPVFLFFESFTTRILSFLLVLVLVGDFGLSAVWTQHAADQFFIIPSFAFVESKYFIHFFLQFCISGASLMQSGTVFVCIDQAWNFNCKLKLIT